MILVTIGGDAQNSKVNTLEHNLKIHTISFTWFGQGLVVVIMKQLWRIQLSKNSYYLLNHLRSAIGHQRGISVITYGNLMKKIADHLDWIIWIGLKIKNFTVSLWITLMVGNL